mgnify:CR=1 FL=1
MFFDGWVKVYRLTPSGSEAVVAVFTRGQSFAEAAAFVAGRFPASGEAVTDGRILRLSSGNLLRLIRQNPDIKLIDSPYDDKEWVAMPALKLDAALIHVDRADARVGLSEDVAELAAELGERREKVGAA